MADEFPTGSFYIVRYDVGGPEFWHERLVVGCAADGEQCCILTPDGDLYVEPCQDDHDDICAIKKLDGQGSTPNRYGRKEIYRFRTLPTEAQ